MMQFVETCPALRLSNGRVDYNRDQVLGGGFHYPEFTRATFACAPGYRRFGAPRSDCVRGRWTEQVPKCNKSNDTFLF